MHYQSPPASLTLNDWDNKIGILIKHTFKFMKSTPTAMIRENKDDFGLGCHSISVEYHRRNAEAPIHSMNIKATNINVQQRSCSAIKFPS
jgi:hypothetical protein